VLAAAGLRRLGFAARISAAIPLDVCVPAPGQGIVAIEVRAGDPDSDAIRSINDAEAFAALSAERAVVTALGGGCQLPLGAVAVLERDSLSVHAIVASPNGGDAIRKSIHGPIGRAAALGQQLADELAAAGAAEILAAVRSGATS